jgi:hypothetical protein
VGSGVADDKIGMGYGRLVNLMKETACGAVCPYFFPVVTEGVVKGDKEVYDQELFLNFL